MFSRQYPDSGSVRTMLSDIDKRIADYLKLFDKKNKTKTEEGDSIELGEEAKTAKSAGIFAEKEIYNRRKFIPGGSVRALSAVCTQIALENVGCVHYALLVISRMIDSLDDMKEKHDIIDLVYHKLINQPNSTYNQLWLQNMTYTYNKEQGTSPYTLRLCQLVAGKTVEPLWNNDWLKSELTDNFPYDSVVNRETLKKVSPVITFRETRAYSEAPDYLQEHKKRSEYYLPTDEDIKEGVTLFEF